MINVIRELIEGQVLHISKSYYKVVGKNRDERKKKFVDGEYVLEFIGYEEGFDGRKTKKPGTTIVVKVPWRLYTLKSIT